MASVNSLDTNILIYAVNSDCPEHAFAKAVYESLLRKPWEWIIADQVLFEFYRALQNPHIFGKPLSRAEAVEQMTFLREKSGCLPCSYTTAEWKRVRRCLVERDQVSAHIFDVVLAQTLLANGVEAFHTRNVRHFENFGFRQLINPIDS